MAERGLGFEETELRLGLPDSSTSAKSAGKRGFVETIDLKLKLQTSTVVVDDEEEEMVKTPVVAAPAVDIAEKMKKSSSQSNLNVLAAFNITAAAVDPAKPRAPKAQVVGWPPVRSFRKNILTAKAEKEGKEQGEKSAAFVKVSMDGAPYLRKVDLKMYKSYKELSMALENMFSSFISTGNCTSQGMNGTNESKLMDLSNGLDYVSTYEDKDGDWMLVGDVPWQMFVESCKRLRLMNGSEASGLAPRAMEKCKNKS